MKPSANRRRRRSLGRRPSVRTLAIISLIVLTLWYFKKDAPEIGPLPPTLVEEEVVPASFTHEVRPVLASHCFSCHGGKTATLPRLDTREVGDLILAQKSPQGGLGLPSDGTHQGLLSLRETSLLMRWRDEGAPFEEHWAFQPLPHKLTPPEKYLDSPWVRNGIDQFTLQHLAKSHTLPIPAADRLTLLRRVTIDLTGLPPGLEEAEMLLASDNPERDYQFFADEFLASVEFSNTFASLWLNTLSYVDPAPATDPAPFWLWRDWVVDWINRNGPIDDFLRHQLAGDLSHPSMREKKLATAIFRAPLRAPGKKLAPPEQLADNLDDRLFRLGKAFLGFPLFDPAIGAPGIDPVTLSDLETLRALWTVEGESGTHPPGSVSNAPTGLLPTPAQAQALAATQADIFRLEKLILENRRSELATFEAWLDTPDKIPVIPDLRGLFHCDAPGATLPNQALGMTSTGSAPTALAVPGVHRSALTLGEGTTASFSDLCPASPHAPWTLSFWMRLLDHPHPTTTLLECLTAEEAPARFFLEHQDGQLTAGWNRAGPTQSLLITTPLPHQSAREWSHLTWTCDGSGRASGLQLYLNGEPAPLTIVADELPIPLFGGQKAPPLLFGSQKKNSGSFLLDELSAYHRALTPVEIRHLKDQKGLFHAFADPLRHHADLGKYYFSSISSRERALQGELIAARMNLASIHAQLTEIPILRGAPGSTSLPAKPLFQHLFAPSHTPTLTNRLDLAQWLTSADHPLTARVFVNRVWAHFFGEGLAPSGFGLAGGTISQPALLDWLARDFIDHGWDLRRLCRQIVLSETYRQTLTTSRRLPRDTQREILLSLCGLLAPPSAEMPPPSGKPWRSLFLAHQPSWSQDWQPLAPEDGPLLPEETLITSARFLTQELLQKFPNDDRARMRELFLRFRCRDESHPEFEILLTLLAAQKESFQGDEAGTPQLILGAGITPDQKTDPREWAAWLEICSSLLSDPNLLEQR